MKVLLEQQTQDMSRNMINHECRSAHLLTSLASLAMKKPSVPSCIFTWLPGLIRVLKNTQNPQQQHTHTLTHSCSSFLHWWAHATTATHIQKSTTERFNTADQSFKSPTVDDKWRVCESVKTRTQTDTDHMCLMLMSACIYLLLIMTWSKTTPLVIIYELKLTYGCMQTQYNRRREREIVQHKSL